MMGALASALGKSDPLALAEVTHSRNRIEDMNERIIHAAGVFGGSVVRDSERGGTISSAPQARAGSGYCRCEEEEAR